MPKYRPHPLHKDYKQRLKHLKQAKTNKDAEGRPRSPHRQRGYWYIVHRADDQMQWGKKTGWVRYNLYRDMYLKPVPNRLPPNGSWRSIYSPYSQHEHAARRGSTKGLYLD